jgi:hypothetical protein
MALRSSVRGHTMSSTDGVYCANCSNKLDSIPGFDPNAIPRVPCPNCGAVARRFDVTANVRVATDFWTRVGSVAASAAIHPLETTYITSGPSLTPSLPPIPEVSERPAPSRRPAEEPAARPSARVRLDRVDPSFKLVFLSVLGLTIVACGGVALGDNLNPRAAELAYSFAQLGFGAFVGLLGGKSL